MTGLGTIINSVSIIAGGFLGHLIGKLFDHEQQDAISKTCGVSVLFIAIAGAMEGMLKIEGTKISSGRSMLVVLCLVIGTIIGELIGIEKGFEHFGEWLKKKTGNSGFIFILDRVCFDLLCRNKSGLGKEIKCSEYAAGCIACNFSGICTVGVLKIIRVFEVTRKGYYQGEIT